MPFRVWFCDCLSSLKRSRQPQNRLRLRLPPKANADTMPWRASAYAARGPFPKAPYPQNEGRVGPFHRLILSVIGERDSLDLTDFPHRRQFLAVIRDQHGSRVAQLHNELFLKVDIQGVPLMLDALAVFAVRSRRNPAIALRPSTTYGDRWREEPLAPWASRFQREEAFHPKQSVPPMPQEAWRSQPAQQECRRRDDSIRFRDSRRRHSRRGRFFPTHRIAGKSGILPENTMPLPQETTRTKGWQAKAHDFPRDVPQRGQHGFPVRAALLPDL